MSFAVRAATNTLATSDNLARWRKIVTPKCTLLGCTEIGSLGHILSNCPKMLDHYTHRHDSVLAPIFENLKKHKPDSVEMYADLEGCSTSGGTIPADTLLTTVDQIQLVLTEDAPQLK